MPDTNETCSRRIRTTTAPQALYVLNSELIYKQAQALAGRVLQEAGKDSDSLIARAFQLALSRKPSGDEQRLAREFLERQAKLARERAVELALPMPMPW